LLFIYNHFSVNFKLGCDIADINYNGLNLILRFFCFNNFGYLVTLKNSGKIKDKNKIEKGVDHFEYNLGYIHFKIFNIDLFEAKVISFASNKHFC
jgi:hypothetical protein